jgi:hypothetical protein
MTTKQQLKVGEFGQAVVIGTMREEIYACENVREFKGDSFFNM